MEYERCGKVVIMNEVHAGPWRDKRLANILRWMRHDGCAGLPGKAGLLTGIDAAAARPVRRARDG